MSITERNHSKFLSHLDASDSVRWKIAQWLSERGNVVTLGPVFKAANHSEWESFADDGDLHILQRIEVKRLSAEFSGLTDWPFKDFIVCARHAYDRARPKPFAFIIVSASGSYAAVVFSTNVKTWTVEKRTDKRYENVVQEFYFSPLSEVLWIEL